MTTTELIQKLQKLDLDKEFLITKGISKVDISKPIKLTDILFRKKNRSISYTTLEDLPFEMNYTINAFDCFAYKETYTLLGVLFLELLFSSQSFLELKIQHQKSEFKQLFIYIDREDGELFRDFLEIENKETYKSFEYYSQKVDKFALSQFPQNTRTVSKDNLATFLFGCSDRKYNYSKEFVEKSDQLIISTKITGLIQLSELLLDIGRLKNPLNEICLENPIYGFGGVSNQSVDVTFWLPNSFAFYTEKIEDLQF